MKPNRGAPGRLAEMEGPFTEGSLAQLVVLKWYLGLPRAEQCSGTQSIDNVAETLPLQAADHLVHGTSLRAFYEHAVVLVPAWAVAGPWGTSVRGRLQHARRARGIIAPGMLGRVARAEADAIPRRLLRRHARAGHRPVVAGMSMGGRCRQPHRGRGMNPRR